MAPKVIPSVSVETQELIRFIDGPSRKPGDIISYSQINNHLRFDVRTKRGILQTARKHELSEGRVWEAVRNVGIKLLTNSETVDVGTNAGVVKMRRTARKYTKYLQSVDYDTLAQDKKNAHNLGMTLYNFWKEVSSSGPIKKLGNVIDKYQHRLSLPETIKAFGIKIKETEFEEDPKS